MTLDAMPEPLGLGYLLNRRRVAAAGEVEGVTLFGRAFNRQLLRDCGSECSDAGMDG